jgi:TonB-dependent starch-binding outer membrane protein SusC
MTGPGIDSRYPQSPMNDLDPNEIESVEIIKGPAAATLYGTEASNGVVNIITKRGRVGAPVFALTVKRGAAGWGRPSSR